MRLHLALVFVLGPAAAVGAQGTALQGAGATTVAPLVAAWAKAYARRPGAVVVQYQASGSVAGVEAVKSGQAQFAFSEARISVPELQATHLVQFPVLVEGIVPIVNLPGVEPGALRLTGPVLADVFAGRIKTWSDEAIVALNLDLRLPPTPVTVIHREDGSGSTFLFTFYLAGVSPAWKETVGAGAVVKWPTGIGVSGSNRLVEQVKATPGAIGYVDLGHLEKERLAGVRLRNRDGAFVEVTVDGVAAAAAHAPWSTAPAFAILIVDQGGPTTWPITGALFAVLRREQEREAGTALLRFFDYALGDGMEISRSFGALPVPADVAQIVRDAWPRLVRTASGERVWPPRNR